MNKLLKIFLSVLLGVGTLIALGFVLLAVVLFVGVVKHYLGAAAAAISFLSVTLLPFLSYIIYYEIFR